MTRTDGKWQWGKKCKTFRNKGSKNDPLLFHYKIIKTPRVFKMKRIEDRTVK